jgi:hypothetical protein
VNASGETSCLAETERFLFRSAEGEQALLVSREVASDVLKLKGVQQDLRVVRITRDLMTSRAIPDQPDLANASFE